MTSEEPYMFGRDFFLGERVVYRGFTCAHCGREFMTTTTEAEANREYLESGQASSDGISSVCDDCYEWFREQGLIN